MRRVNLPPTKSNLLRLKEDFSFIQSGHELLDRKREILLEELIDVQREALQLRREVEAELAAVYGALRAALLAAGRAPLESEALAVVGGEEVQLRERSVMGVIVPLLEIQVANLPEPVVAPGWGPPSLAAIRPRVRALLGRLTRLAEIEISSRRLAAELLRTQRKVNALESIFIPEHRASIQFIEASLEEREREALFQLKRLKSGRPEQ